MSNIRQFPPEPDFLEALVRLGTPRPRTTGESDGLAFRRLLDVIDHLRGEEGCPFDRQQTIPRLARDLAEEMLELRDAVDEGSSRKMASEIGDMILILLFIRRLLWETDQVTVSSVLDHTSEKMIRRHPHVFLDPDPDIDAKTLWTNWEKEKRKEEEHKDRTSILDGLPRTLSALETAFRQGEKAARVGFDWTDEGSVWEKVLEEVGELSEARFENPGRLDHELGDVFLALSSYARHKGIRPEESLARANRRFSDRFRYMEEQARIQDRDLSSFSADEWNRLWESAKSSEAAIRKKDGQS